MDEKKDAVLDDAVVDGSEAETTGEDAAVAVEPEGDNAPESDGENSADAQDAEPAKEVVESSEPAESAEPEGSSEPVAASEATVPTPPAKDKPKEKRAKGSGIGDLVAVGIFSIILGVLLALPSFMGVTGESGGTESSASGSVAATVNGTAVSEDEITKYIMDFRTQQGLEDDSAWGEWMVMYGYTPEALRSDTIEFFVNRALLKQAIAEEGIEVADSEVDDYISMITEQVGGQSAFEEALKTEGLTLDTYRENVLFSLQQQALAEKVAPAAEVDDAQVLELVKMYFPDKVDEDATSLEGVDEATIEEIRSMLASSATQQAFDEWMQTYRQKANVVTTEMPASAPYNIDLAPYQAQEDSADASGSAEAPEIEVEEASGESASASVSAESQEK